jgi:hypothetical protein
LKIRNITSKSFFCFAARTGGLSAEEVTALQSLEISLLYKKVGPLVRNATFKDNRWKILADDL